MLSLISTEVILSIWQCFIRALFSIFCESLKIKKSLELLNMIFENSSIKGIFGPNMSDSPNWWLTANSRSLQAAALKNLIAKRDSGF